MKTNKTNKKSVQLCGNLIGPLAIGQSAVFKAEACIYRTSPVVAIHEVATDSIRFETENTNYHLLPAPYPAAIICQFPVEQAACA